MSDCCTSSCHDKPEIMKLECPVCQQPCLNVPNKTVLQHIKQPWLHRLSEQHYFFCRTPDCDVVYFLENGETINKTDVRAHIGIKEQDDESLICFCFGVTKAEAAKNKSIKDFVIQQTKESNCTCETTNPSGRCCLKDFPKF